MAKKKQQVRKRAKDKTVRKGRGKGTALKNDKGDVVNMRLQFPRKDWELFKIACEKYARKYEEVLKELAVKWAEDVMKTELPPPG
jgi:hypothetical protein